MTNISSPSPADLERHVLLLVKLVVVRPNAWYAPAQVVPQLAVRLADLVEDAVAELVEDVGVPVGELEEGDDGL